MFRKPSSMFLATVLSTSSTLVTAGGLGIHIGGSVGEGLKTLEHKAKQESKNAVENTVEAAETVGKTAERQVQSIGDVAKTTEKMLRDGKPIDAWIHFTTEPYKATEENALRAVQESSMLRMAGQFTANTFAPGVGGAAFTVWYVEGTTGNLESALKAGAVTAASGAALGKIGEGPVKGWVDGAGRAVASGSVVGTATVVMGGDFEDGFKSAALASALKSGVEAYSEKPLDPKPGSPSIAKGTTGECAPYLDCTVVDTADDMRKISSDVNSLGKTTPDIHAQDIPWDHEGSEFMNTVNKVPGMNALSHPHDVFTTQAELGPISTVATIPPTGIITYTAMGTARDQKLLNLSVENAENDKRD